VARGLDRLRWLFADRLDWVVINQEPAVESVLATGSRAQADRAGVMRYVGVGEDLRTLRINGEKRVPAARWMTRPTRSRSVPRHPVVFCHGMLAMTMLRMQMPEDTNYFSHLRPFLRERGIEALYPNVEPTGGVAERAEQLRDLIRHWTDEPINLIAHSMGGLDARYMISRLGMAGRVLSLTTLGTPHRGTAFADWGIRRVERLVKPVFELLGLSRQGFHDLTTAACRRFNEQTPDAPNVRYFSVAAQFALDWTLPEWQLSHRIIEQLEGPNDGLVSVASARWGEAFDVWEGDHASLVNRALTPSPVRLRWGDRIPAYAALLQRLADAGF